MGELPPLRDAVTPGHQIVGRVEKGGPGVAAEMVGRRVGVSWMGGVDGTCLLCLKGHENLCDDPTFTGYSVNGGYAEYTVARSDFCVPLPEKASAEMLAPLLCAGIIGFRSLRVAGVESGDRVGLFGFGASAHLAIDVLKHWGCEVYVATRGESHRQLARELGAAWVGDALDRPPQPLDRAVTFAPSGDVVLAALGSLRKGGVVAINAIHLDRMPEFDYDSLLWGERQIRSVANMTREDAKDFVALAHEIGIRPKTTTFPLAEVNLALAAVRCDAVNGAAVVLCQE
jgi:propanol-preferring alcohol dehydrogenase